MESTLFVNYIHPQRFPPYPYHSSMYSSVLSNNSSIAAQSSFVRSSAQLHTPSAQAQSQQQQQYFNGNYPQQPPPVEGYQDDTSSSSSSNSAVLSHDMNIQEHPQDYPESHYGFAPSSANPQSYQQHVPRSLAWGQDKHQLYNDYAPSNFESQAAQSRYTDAAMYTNGYFDHAQKEGTFVPPELTPFYGGQDSGLSQEPALTAYTAQGTYLPLLVLSSWPHVIPENVLPSVVYSSSGSPRINTQNVSHDQTGSPASVYGLGSPTLQYPPTPEDGVPPRFVSMQDISPSPTVSPDQVCSTLPANSSTFDYTLSQSPFIASEASPVSLEYEEGHPDMFPAAAAQRKSPAADEQPRKRRRVKSEDEESGSTGSVDSGESEREDEGDDADDDDYSPDSKDQSRTNSNRRTSLRQASTSTTNSRSFSPLDVQRPRLAPPVPVPNLTKKSRGRRVPTSAVVVSQNGVEKVCARPSACVARPGTDALRCAIEYSRVQMQGSRMQ